MMRQTKTRSERPFKVVLILLLLVALTYAIVSAFGGTGTIKVKWKELFDDYEKPEAPETDDYGIQEALKELTEKNPEASAFVDAYVGIEAKKRKLGNASDASVSELQEWCR